MKTKQKTLYIKPSHEIGDIHQLNPDIVARNAINGIETTLLLDTNILIGMEKVVKNGNKWSSVKNQGLHNLVSFLLRCPPKTIHLSPGLAWSEMPTANANISAKYYEEFCRVFLPNFINTPNSTLYIDENKKENSFNKLDYEAQVVLALPFTCLLYLNFIDKTYKKSPVEKFTKFLRFLEKEVDILSAVEIEIARYSFAEPPAKSRRTIETRKKIRSNFLKTNKGKNPKNSEELVSVALNGARDITLISASNVFDSNGLDGVAQDTWIATKDKKLAEFCKIFHHINIDGKIAAHAVIIQEEEHSDDPYWKETLEIFNECSIKRIDYCKSRETDPQKIVDIALTTVKMVEQKFL